MAPPTTRPADGSVTLRGIRKTFASTVAVDDVDLEVADGEFFAMLGPSGSGKTTVLRMIAGFEQPTEGTVLLGGSDVTAVPPHRRDVTTVFQDYALFPHMTLRENVEYGLRARNVATAERRRRAGDALAMVRLDHVADRKPAQLSGGQRQRVALARSLAVRPKVLLLDEPLGALDLKLREEMQVELKAIQREVGITFVFVTHDQDEALTLCDRLAVFNEGRIEQVGSARAVYEEPVNRFVAGFVGTSNILSGETAQQVVGRSGTWAVRPEKIGVLADTAPAPAGATVREGSVTEVVYAGASTRVLADLGPVTVTITSLNTAAASIVQRGDRIRLAWTDEALHQLTD
ncbi:ABC transporter ATP-binding protein [Nocardioides sp. BP30]|uniref:ABC transporter ATP-binding protein n=1 Tax=Nocardioides sp. BP30 TaxID=3036374 RepID=UPI002468F98A|nr:ABC transporter ATP-binding protein [Nocardioides sp. BP30]WGL53742.1 ABC transporter ATP-binding protein [Nocardioides sp. BP30]